MEGMELREEAATKQRHIAAFVPRPLRQAPPTRALLATPSQRGISLPRQGEGRRSLSSRDPASVRKHGADGGKSGVRAPNIRSICRGGGRERTQGEGRGQRIGAHAGAGAGCQALTATVARG